MKTLRSLARSKRLFGVNAVLAGLSVGFSVYIVWNMTTPLGPSVGIPPTPVGSTIIEPDTTPMLATPALYAAVASRNLFSPTRTDRQAVDAAVVGTPGLRLHLLGVVLAGEGSIAYLEDPASKHVYGYRLGDSVAGATIRAIEAGRIVLERRNQWMDVPLHDPSRPKASLPVVVATADGADVVGRSTLIDNRTDTVSSATLPTAPAAQPLQSRPSLSRFGIVAPTIPRAR